MSPVPGGRSKTRISVPPQATSLMSCSMALPAIGPRQTTGVCRSTRYPTDMVRTPKRSIGTIRWFSTWGCAPSRPSISGIEGP